MFKSRPCSKLESDSESGYEVPRYDSPIINETQASIEVNYAYCERYDTEENNADERQTTFIVASHQSISISNSRSATDGIAQSIKL